LVNFIGILLVFLWPPPSHLVCCSKKNLATLSQTSFIES
jgi:hypothetical protein